MRRIRNNFGLKLLAVALAIVGWAYFRFSANPVLAARFDQQISVPILPINVPVGNVVHFTEKEAVVTVQLRGGEPAVKPDEVKAVLDLSGKTAGVYNVPVQLVAPNVAIHSLTPASVTLSLEKIAQKTFPIALHYTGNTGAVIVGSSSVTPAEAIARGASSALSEVTSLRLDVPLPSGPAQMDEMIRPAAVNALGQEVPGVQVSPDLVRIQVRFATGTAVQHR